MKDYIAIYMQYLEMKAKHFRMDVRDLRSCLNHISAGFRNRLNQGECSSQEIRDEAPVIGVSIEHLAEAVQAYFKWRRANT